MNNKQLDMVLGYLNEGAEIDIDEYKFEQLYEEALLESNADVNDTRNEYQSKLNKLTREYNKAFKAKNKEEMNAKYEEILSALNDFEKEINTIKVTKGDTAKGAISAALYYGAVLYLLKLPMMGSVVGNASKAILAGSTGYSAFAQIKTIIKEIKKNGLTAESLNIYKTNCKHIISSTREGIKKRHKKNLEKLNKEK